MTINNDSVHTSELHYLRRYGFIFPLLAMLTGAVWALWGWKFILLNAEFSTAGFTRAWIVGCLFLAVMGGMIPYVWRMVIRFEQRHPSRMLWPLAPVLALLFLGAAEVVARTMQIQGPFWLGVEARLRPGSEDYFIRELVYLRLDVFDALRREQRGKQIFVGSSQVLQGIDFERLHSLIEPMPVLRRAIAGMDPVQACGAQDYLSIRPGDRVVFHLSEFDMTGSSELQANWMRPLVTRRGWMDVVSSLDNASRVRYARPLTDLAASAVSELWRMRDYARYVLQHPFGNPAVPTAPHKLDAAFIAAARRVPAGEGLSWYETNFRAFEILVREIKQQGADVLVFEGRTNPSIWSEDRQRLRDDTRARLKALSGTLGFTYVPLQEQAVTIVKDDWLDTSHLNPVGREKLTRYVADYLVSHTAAKPAPSP